jgi:glutamate--cysteine ligase
MSGAAFSQLAETETELRKHLEELAAVEEEFPVRIQWSGVNPWQGVEQVQWVPKSRYGVMRRYLPTRGDLALSMMGTTCTVQANLDITSETDFSRKLRVSSSISALVTAMFANSPIAGGRVSGYQSYRAHIWTRTDPDRCGLPRFVWSTDAGYEDYVDWALDVPLFFLSRDGAYIDMGGKATFRDLLEGRVAGQRATAEDWILHLSTLFPDVRARPYLEVRASDCVPPDCIMACPALWKGLLYVEDIADAAWDLVKHFTYEQRVELSHDVAKHALKTPLPRGRGQVRDLCRELLEMSTEGLRQLASLGQAADSDGDYLIPLRSIVDSGMTFADRQLQDRSS